jgi:nitroreductase
MAELHDYETLLKVAQARRTARGFKPDPVPAGYVEKILGVARWAPSGFHTQPWEFVVVDDPKVKARIVAVLDRKAPPIRKDDKPRPSFRDAPVFILALQDWRAKTGLPGHPNEVSPRVASIYCSGMSSAFLLMHLAAASLGLASQWYSSTASEEAQQGIREIIGFPDEMTIYDMMVLGYPSDPLQPKFVRELKDMVHYNACGGGDFRNAAQVADYATKTYDWCLNGH